MLFTADWKYLGTAAQIADILTLLDLLSEENFLS